MTGGKLLAEADRTMPLEGNATFGSSWSQGMRFLTAGPAPPVSDFSVKEVIKNPNWDLEFCWSKRLKPQRKDPDGMLGKALSLTLLESRDLYPDGRAFHTSPAKSWAGTNEISSSGSGHLASVPRDRLATRVHFTSSPVPVSRVFQSLGSFCLLCSDHFRPAL